ncbi:MAG: hypothetical protein WC882_00810 [Candidatus Gracilibacteria bacterium]
MRNPSLSTKSLSDSIRSILFLIAGMALVLGTPFVVAAPTATPPSGTVIPNFSAIAVSTYTTAVDYNASSGIWVGSASKTTGAASIPSTGAYVYATNAGRLVAHATTQSSGILGSNNNVSTGQSGVLGGVSITGIAGTTTASGSLGYRDSTGLYGVYTSGAAKVGSLYVTSGITTNSITGDGGTLNIYGDTNIQSSLEVHGTVMAHQIGDFDGQFVQNSGSGTTVTAHCLSGYTRIACGGFSTTNNFRGTEAVGTSSCRSHRSGEDGILTAYAYCFNPSALSE